MYVLECVCVLYLYIFVSVLSQEVLHVMEFTVKHLSPHQALSQHIIHCLLLFVIIFRSSLLPPLLLYNCISSTWSLPPLPCRYIHVLFPSLPLVLSFSLSHYTHTTLLSFSILGCYFAAILYSVTHLTGLSVTVSFIFSWIISWLIILYLLLLITATYTRYTECVSIYIQ